MLRSVSRRVTQEAGAFGLGAGDVERVREQVGRALTDARGSGRPALAAVTTAIAADLDLSAAVLAARRPEDRYACLEQPDRDGFALAGLGQAATLEAHGPGRF